MVENVGIFVALVLYGVAAFAGGVKWYHEALKKPGKIEKLKADVAEAELKFRSEFGDVKAHAAGVIAEAELEAKKTLDAVRARVAEVVAAAKG